jgi:hypothetical protein
MNDPDAITRNEIFFNYPNSSSIVEVQILNRTFHNVSIKTSQNNFNRLFFTFLLLQLSSERITTAPTTILSQKYYLDNIVNDWSDRKISSIYDTENVNSEINTQYPLNKNLVAIRYNFYDYVSTDDRYNQNQIFFTFIQSPTYFYKWVEIIPLFIIYLSIPWILFYFARILYDYRQQIPPQILPLNAPDNAITNLHSKTEVENENNEIII